MVKVKKQQGFKKGSHGNVHEKNAQAFICNFKGLAIEIFEIDNYI